MDNKHILSKLEIQICDIGTDDLSWGDAEILVYEVIRRCTRVIVFCHSLVRILLWSTGEDMHFVHEPSDKFAANIDSKVSPKKYFETALSRHVAEFL